VRCAGGSPGAKTALALALQDRKDLRQFCAGTSCRPGLAGSFGRFSTPARQTPVATLTKAGRYDLREELGRGAMGIVYHGFDPVIGRDVAVKTMRLSEAGTGLTHEELIGRFQTEARAAGLLTHPNIVVVYDAGEEDGLFYITMEFVEGKSLQSLIDSHQLFPLPRVMKLFEQVCSALDFAHQHNVVHRDIKPANLMLTADDTVKITDFGTAKILQFGTAQTAHVMGTPSYMSPEQVKGKPVDGRSDIFSLGVILYELMTGEKPFPGQNVTTVIYKIVNEEPIPPRSIDSSIHPGLSTVITRALAKDPATRYQSCQEFLSALKNYHEIATPEATVRLTPANSQISPGATLGSALPARQPPGPLFPQQSEAVAPPQLFSSVAAQHEAPKRGARLLLTLVLLAIIGFAGYRVYPPLKDLWQRAQETPLIPSVRVKREAAPAAANPESPIEKPTEIQSDSTQPATSAPNPNASHEADQSPKRPPQPVLPAVEVKAPEPPTPQADNPEKSIAPQRPIPTAAPAPARLFESKLREEIAGLPLADKVEFVSTASTLTLSGSLTLAEYRELRTHLRTVPPGVRVIDDISTEGQNAASPTASAGWVWVRSSPPGARIVVDGDETGLRTPSRLELHEGPHVVSLVHQGFGISHRSVEVRAGETMQFTEFLPIE